MSRLDLILAAQAVVRDALEQVEVHPCDENDDTVRANGLYGSIRALYAAISQEIAAVNPDMETAERFAMLESYMLTDDRQTHPLARFLVLNPVPESKEQLRRALDLAIDRSCKR